MPDGARTHEGPIASLEVQEGASVDTVRGDGTACLDKCRDAFYGESTDVTAFGARKARRDSFEHERRIRGSVLARPPPERATERVSLVVFARLFPDFGGKPAYRRGGED